MADSRQLLSLTLLLTPICIHNIVAHDIKSYFNPHLFNKQSTVLQHLVSKLHR